MNKAFSLAEILIVVAILGILAAIAIPQFQSHSQQAKAAAARKNLRTLRVAIELYAAQHNGIPPGYPDGNMAAAPTPLAFAYQLCGSSNQFGQTASPGTPGYELGPYVETAPKNPFNNHWGLTIIGNDDEIPSEPPSLAGWVYQPVTKTIKLDWPGVDKEGVPYYSY
jgi:type IV pilus assembly protein PilA